MTPEQSSPSCLAPCSQPVQEARCHPASALLARIENFDIDGDPAALPFAARLAREHGWSRPRAERVIREYKRYVFLCMNSATPVCPSEDVDAAWHLHLTYTRSYWKRFCGDVLGRPLHHEPTKGGPAEADKHLAMYEATLAAYRESFGVEPPHDIWPSAHSRFGIDIQHRVVNTAHNWVIPKLPVKRVLHTAAAFLIVAILVPGCDGGEMNPFNLKGASFLGFLIPMMIAAVCVGRVIRSAMRSPGPNPQDHEEGLRWQHAAYLVGGYARLTTAAIARLAEVKVIRVVEERLEAGKVEASEALSAVEKAIVANLPISKQNLSSVQQAVEQAFSAEVSRLDHEGITLSKSRQIAVSLGSVLPFAAVMLFLALPRLGMGFLGNKAIGFLVATMIIGGILGLILCLRGPKNLSRRGEALLAELKTRNAKQKTERVTNAGLAVALFGTVVLAGSSVAYLQTWYPRQTGSSGSGSGCGSGCGTSSYISGDSGGGGDGDGGGGGCGGCGGGGGGD